MVHEGAQPQMPSTKLAIISCPCVVSSTSGWNWKPYRRKPVRSDRREAVPASLALAERSVAELLESLADAHHRVEVAHEDLLDRRQPREQRVVADDVQARAAPLAAAVDHLASVVLGDFLVAEAEAEDGDVEVVDRLGVARVLAERREARAAREDDPPVAREHLDRIVGLADLRQDAQAPHLGRDQVRVLPAEIDDGNRVVMGHRHGYDSLSFGRRQLG